MAKLNIDIGDRKLVLRTNLFEGGDEIDIDRILRIDHNYIVAESLTFSVLLNKLGILMIDAESKVKEARIDMEIWISKERERLRTEWDADPDRPVVRGSKYTIDQIKDAVDSSATLRIKRKRINELEKIYGYLNTIYWSAKSKDQRLNEFTKQIRDEDIDFSELNGRVFNGVTIKAKEPLIKG